jgi:hypothetical protein
MSFFSQMALLRLEFSLPDSAQRKTSVFSATHDNNTWSINVTRGDAVINREIMVQTGGLFCWEISQIACNAPNLRGSWTVDVPGRPVDGTSFHGRTGDRVALIITPCCVVEATATYVRLVVVPFSSLECSEDVCKLCHCLCLVSCMRCVP